MTTELTRSTNIDALLLKREKFVAEIKAAYAHIDAAKNIYEESELGGQGIYRTSFLSLGTHRFTSFGSEKIPTQEDILKGFDAIAWKYLMSESGLQSFMSSPDLQAWSDSIYDKTTPSFELQNIQSTFEKLYSERGSMLERGVIAIYRGLSWDYKSNKPVKFGKKLVISGGRSSETIPNDISSQIDDLNRFMHVADGQPQPDHRNGFLVKHGSKLAINASGFNSPYFEVRGFKNGNLHVIFTNEELVSKMNEILAKHHPHALPAPSL